MKQLFTLLLFISLASLGHAHGSMPTIKPKKVFTVKSAQEGEALHEERGFGHKEAEIRMMNLMMVEGSGYEGMKMSADMGQAKVPHAAHGSGYAATPANRYEATITPNPPKKGANTLDFTLVGADGKPLKGAKLKATVSMIGMDMGIDEPKVREITPGKYQVKVIFSMTGPWMVKILSNTKDEKLFEYKFEYGVE